MKSLLIQKNKSRLAYFHLDLLFLLLLFTVILLFVLSYVNENLELEDKSLLYNQLGSDAKHLCYVLTQTTGYPINWSDEFRASGELPVFIGLKQSSSSHLNVSKVLVLNTTTYANLTDVMNVSGYVGLVIRDIHSKQIYHSWGRLGGSGAITARSVCYGMYNSSPVQIEVGVWR